MRCAPEGWPSQPTNVRSYFTSHACHVHAHPSSGGILVKVSVNLVDLRFLSLPTTTASKRSDNPEEEDAFCELMRRIGATWWEDEAKFLRAHMGEDRYDGDPRDDESDDDVQVANEARARQVVVFGWPEDGVGVWVLRRKYDKWHRNVPGDYGRMNFASSMEERIEVMKDFGAEFVEDLTLVRELHEPWERQSPEVIKAQYAVDYPRAASTSASSSECEDYHI